MAISCPRCGAGFDVTLFQFGRAVRCDCGQWVDLAAGHARPLSAQGGRVMAEVEVGKVTHYFGKIHVAGIEITQDKLRVGDTIHIHGHTSDFTQQVDSMQVDNEEVAEASAGQMIGIRVVDHAREHDVVYKVLE